eukprot:992449_1
MPSSDTLFVGNLQWKVRSGELRNFLAGYVGPSNITRVEIPTKSLERGGITRTVSTGLAFVRFSSEDVAKSLLGLYTSSPDHLILHCEANIFLGQSISTSSPR